MASQQISLLPYLLPYGLLSKEQPVFSFKNISSSISFLSFRKKKPKSKKLSQDHAWSHTSPPQTTSSPNPSWWIEGMTRDTEWFNHVTILLSLRHYSSSANFFYKDPDSKDFRLCRPTRSLLELFISATAAQKQPLSEMGRVWSIYTTDTCKHCKQGFGFPVQRAESQGWKDVKLGKTKEWWEDGGAAWGEDGKFHVRHDEFEMMVTTSSLNSLTSVWPTLGKSPFKFNWIFPQISSELTPSSSQSPVPTRNKTKSCFSSYSTE